MRGFGNVNFPLVCAIEFLVVGLIAIQGFDAVDFIEVVESDVARAVGFIGNSTYWFGYLSSIWLWCFLVLVLSAIFLVCVNWLV